MKTHTILIVDDEELILKSISRVLRNENCRILTAPSGEEGLAILKNNDVHLVISDQKMPGMSGLDFLKRVQREYPQILTIMLTGLAELKIAMDAINEAGVYKFILKPWDDNDLKVTVRRALETRELIWERNTLRRQVKTQDAILQELEKIYPDIGKVERDEDGYIVIDI
uniref:Response regulator n=1 Tax=Candidatus Desulfatibia profunda TaxID=2841695 RepID=A0A8J6NXZ3_9BACT|nr:response regulator [Candidatus Desulfatibia profunda]